ncbi:predicted protein [Naegleria gruberi]|uniref:Predicted protein n=1 Tax=Naegleria gruberi TaxID=5762 RepID=D2V9Y1_NAEGR|nr:uncharacterized protein NAEGRDRAFT_65668 [Naegleria gruberi]EFC46331.1 predicted protein [Naegleria gruberi]|eukprot:XP_002679075.1 predicted protein [Naegleria gruberi strain NEG-M]
MIINYLKHQLTQKEKSDMYKHFDRYKLTMKIKDINVDYVDEVEKKIGNNTILSYHAGVSVIVSMTYDNFNSHEQIGCGNFQCDSRGKAVLEAKRIAIDDACQRVCRVFGDIHSGHHNLMMARKQ